MDLQAILDASSSSSDEDVDDYLSRQQRRSIIDHDDTISGISGDFKERSSKCDGDGLLKDDNNDIVSQILLRSTNNNNNSSSAYYSPNKPPSSSKKSSTTAANFELESILREADVNDDDETDESGDNDNDVYNDNVSRERSDYHHQQKQKYKSKHKSNNNSSTDYLLQSILNEADDDDDDDDGGAADHSSDEYDIMNTTGRSLSGLSLMGSRSTRSNVSSRSYIQRRLSSSTTAASNNNHNNNNNNMIPISHSWEVEAILNSVPDDDDDDDGDNDINVDISSSQRHQRSQVGYYAQDSDDDDDDDTDENNNNDDSGLKFNFSRTNSRIPPLPLQQQENVKYDDNNISISQYPLTSRSTPQRDVYVHVHEQHYGEKDESLDNNLKDYTANFLSDIDGGGGRSRSSDEKDDVGCEPSANNAARGGGIKRRSTSITDEEQLSTTLCLKHAQASERKLLQPNTRNIVSPLTVKRRMKPRVELMTKSRSQQKQQQQQQSSSSSSSQFHRQGSSTSSSHQHHHQPRFGFSGGIIQSKSMSTLGSQLLLKSNISKSTSTTGMMKQTTTTTGLPTALAVNSKFIAVGNQRGEVWVFDLFEQLKIILGEDGIEMDGGGNSISTTTTTGSITSIDLSMHGDFLLAGYGSGQIILWDIIRGSVLKHITDLHTSSISSARLTFVPMSGRGTNNSSSSSKSDNEICAVSVDAGGLVNKLVFTRGRLWSSQTYSVEHECLLDGTAGQILAMDALPPLDDMAPPQKSRDNTSATVDEMNFHPSVHQIVLIALSSARSSFAVSIEPKVSVLHRWARPTTERIDPTISDDDALTQVSSAYASSYATSYASSYMSTSTYHTNSTYNESPPKSSSSSSKVDNTPVPYLPCLSWGWALVSGGGHSVTPILARAWGCCLQFLRASFPEIDEYGDDNVVEDDTIVHWPAFGTHDEFDASAPVVALNWLGKRSLVYLTVTNEFIVIDTVIMTMQERLDFSGMKLVYAEFALSRHHRQHPADSKNGLTTFMNSIRSNDNRLLVLCQDEVKEITVLGMRKQIISLEDGGQWLEALALALDHYESSIQSQEDNKRRDDASSALRRLDIMTRSDPSLLKEDEIWLAELLMRYLILAIDNAPESSPLEYSSSSNSPLPPNSRLNLAESHFEMLSGVCLEFCIVTKRLDLLFGPIFRCFYEARYINVFLDVMETYILNDRLKYIAPEAMVLFVSHCKDMKDLSMVERCLLHMDCKLMDFDSILSLLKKNDLFTGLIHVYSSGLDDFISPLEILFDALFESMDFTEDVITNRRKDGVPSNRFEQYGYKILLYLQYCFKGKSFPKGNDILPEERIHTLRPELFDLLFREMGAPPRRSSQPQSRNHSYRGIHALSYPYIRALILIDARALLDCLALALDDADSRFAQAETQLQLESYDVEYETDNKLTKIVSKEEKEDDKALLPNRQCLVDILSSIIMSDGIVDSSYQMGSRKQMTLLSIKAKHFFLDFLAKYLQLGVITAPKSLIGEVFIRMCNKKGASEDSVLSLLQALSRSSYELDEVLYTVERVHMTRGALLLHKQGVTNSLDQESMSDNCQNHFNKAIDCYLADKDDEFKKGVFGYGRKECAGGNVSMLRNVVLQRLPELIKLDAVHAAHLVGDIFVEETDMILSSLKHIESGKVQYSFLHAIISGDLGKVDSVIAQELSANLTVDHHHSYLLLMTTFAPENVYQYLSSNRNYRLNDALKLCQEKKIADASAYLLERMGDVSGALKLMLETLDVQLITLKNILQQSSQYNSHSIRNTHRADSKSNIHQNETAEKEIVRIKQVLSAVLDLCERNKNDHLTSLDNEHGPLLWFHVLDRLVNAKSLLDITKDSTLRVSVDLSTVLSELLLMTMQRMISNVSLFELMHKITKDYAGSDLGEFREMLVSMLKTYSSELDVCSSAVDVMQYDIRQMSYEKKRLKVRGSFVQDCPKNIPRHSFLDIGPTGSYQVRSPRSVYGYGSGNFFSSMTNEQNTVHNTASLLRQRRRGSRYQARKSTNINLMTSSERNSHGHELHDTFERRLVGSLSSDAQNVGGL